VAVQVIAVLVLVMAEAVQEDYDAQLVPQAVVVH
jgi:hypothetical protein